MSKHGRPVSKHKAKEILEHGEVRGHPLTKKQRGLFGAIAGGSPLRKFHRSPDSYGDTALGETPSRQGYSADFERSGGPLASAVGRPTGVRVADGTESPRADVQTKAAGDGRAKSSPNKRRWPAEVRSYNDGAV